jgi:hypothetical protein
MMALAAGGLVPSVSLVRLADDPGWRDCALSGIRVDLSAAVVFGLEINLDFLGDPRVFVDTSKPLFLVRGTLSLEVGWQVVAGIGTGPVLISNMESLNDLGLIHNHIGGTFSDFANTGILAPEPDIGFADEGGISSLIPGSPQTSEPATFYLGLVGAGEDVGIWHNRELISQEWPTYFR